MRRQSSKAVHRVSVLPFSGKRRIGRGRSICIRGVGQPGNSDCWHTVGQIRATQKGNEEESYGLLPCWNTTTKSIMKGRIHTAYHSRGTRFIMAGRVGQGAESTSSTSDRKRREQSRSRAHYSSWKAVPPNPASYIHTSANNRGQAFKCLSTLGAGGCICPLNHHKESLFRLLIF